jgi:hypothetical protein
MTSEEDVSESRASECKPLLDVCTPNVYRYNAFRVTGLFTDASVRDIKRRIDDLKHAEEMGDTKEEHSHAFALDPSPGLEHIREAALRLHDPERRIVEELFWFWPMKGSSGKLDPALLALAKGDKSSPYKTWTQALTDHHSEMSVISKHNLVVMYQMIALDGKLLGLEKNITEESMAKIEKYWHSCFKWWEDLIQDEIFWSLISERIRILDDPQLRTGFTRQIRATLPQALVKINTLLAIQYIEKGKLALASQQLAYLKETNYGINDIHKALLTVTKPLQIRIGDAVAKASEIAECQPEKAAQAGLDLLEIISQPLEIIRTILPEQDYDRSDLFDAVAGTIMQCAVSFGNKTENWQSSVTLLESALKFVASSELKDRVEKNLHTVRQNVEYRQLFEVCWFCKTNAAEDEAKLEVPMHGDVHRDSTLFGGNRVTFRKLSTKVPRCTTCKATHNGTFLMQWLSVVICAIIGTIALSIVGTVIGALVGWCIGTIIVKTTWWSHNTAPKIIKAEYPPIKKLLSENWEFGDSPSS